MNRYVDRMQHGPTSRNEASRPRRALRWVRDVARKLERWVRDFARELDCFTACITCVPESSITNSTEIAIVPVVGAEAITGSTRMKAGTAQKLVLNMISTAAMIRLGYVKGNRMTNVKSSNTKLKERSLRILMAETNLDEASARELMDEANNDLRTALVMFRAGVNRETAESVLFKMNFVVESAIQNLER